MLETQFEKARGWASMLPAFSSNCVSLDSSQFSTPGDWSNSYKSLPSNTGCRSYPYSCLTRSSPVFSDPRAALGFETVSHKSADSNGQLCRPGCNPTSRMTLLLSAVCTMDDTFHHHNHRAEESFPAVVPPTRASAAY